APAEIYPLSLHDALPISALSTSTTLSMNSVEVWAFPRTCFATSWSGYRLYLFPFPYCVRKGRKRMPPLSLTRAAKVNHILQTIRSEEHTSELQSRENLVC